MRLRNLTTFVKVARLGSFHAAAQQLHATQPAVSARIVALEDELGVQLFVRDKSGTRLTARGTQLLPYAEKLLAISQEMREQIQQDTPQRGTVRIGITDTLAHLWLSSLLQHWQQQYPLMSFELSCDVTPALVEQLQNHQLDLALMVTQPQTSPELVTEPLCSYSQHWVASPKLVSPQQITTTADLLHYPLLSFPRDTRPWHYLQQLFNSQRETPDVVHTCSSVASLISLTCQGVGIALLPTPLVQDELEQGELVIIETDQPTPELGFCCSWRLDDDRILPRLLADSGREIVEAPQQ
ncbi:MAG: LysR family transcriptional regulator [Marinobacterium sp.]|nr:LysR family transcriptional regulator [Marinobacterium sp.]